MPFLEVSIWRVTKCEGFMWMAEKQSLFFSLLLSCQKHLLVLTIDSPTSSFLSPLPLGEIIGLCDFH